MQTKWSYISLGIAILLIGIAAFVAGRMFNLGISPVADEGSLRTNEFTFSTSNNVTPAPELPAISPEVVGLYVEMNDNTMIVQVVSMDTGIGSVVSDSSVDVNSAPKVEIIITSKTTIYHEITQLSGLSASIRQTVEESTLDNLNPPTMITVWGNRSGDRIVARILLYSNSLGNAKP